MLIYSECFDVPFCQQMDYPPGTIGQLLLKAARI